ncbi:MULTISPECIES: hydroxymethylbilane synthase [unclassified Streptomyces]|jgi:hydroxymethylbilane synthase|uniref:hydroxymethylbilane synthase n=1 Tax=unclassified Streptomyces TaxID=2593676 RepID=UPI002252B8B1|nr:MULTISPECIES: hydroxymethylbilane synthase [unclassified Streptomyces]WSP55793.1 hydroxymethylbilane synthase [Streptomyces sp. NBC_01241]WSU23470.1 hydroxymethylbilane synthase [Streptomyces sp. NBC_01108]MCX4787503.1 hydroxymethylbilane synthase [Streptomyces sp. NBC_01221]MCX4796712.1 hydroxymethylbilane synthase [Streptomyces sp. NBC_01242]WSJ37940.1 hydroxymethylbilane synthase [Streptomyces sp. NBC_01321]
MTDNSPQRARTDAPLRLGTRRSKLAMAQSGLVADAVSEVTGRAVELVEITTYGDISREHLAQIGGTGVFVAALRDALLRGEVDFAVHSLKDLPTTQPEGLVLAAVPVREDPRDVLVARDGLTLEQLPSGARIGTGSPRRMAQLNAYARSHGLAIETVPIRGNVDTRIGFVRSGELDAVVLAAAGISRLGRTGEVTDFLSVDTVLPAPGQGALAIECAATSADLAAALAELDDPVTRAAVTAERALLAALEAGCSAPVGALADLLVDGQAVNELRLRGVVGSTDGSSLVQMSTTGPVPTSHDDAAALGRELAAEMLAKGAAGLMGERAL